MFHTYWGPVKLKLLNFAKTLWVYVTEDIKDFITIRTKYNVTSFEPPSETRDETEKEKSDI